MSPRHAHRWAIGRRSTDTLFPRTLPGRYTNLEAWDQLLRQAAA